jgi:hypothetical protein
MGANIMICLTSNNSLNQFISAAGKILLDRRFGLVKTNAGTKIRARVMPKQIRSSYICAPETIAWLKDCSTKETPNKNCPENICYTMPIIGITNRPLPGYKKAGFNLFRTFANIITSPDVTNLEQCTIEFEQRLPINAQDLFEELDRQVFLTSSRVKGKGRLTFYCQSLGGLAFTTDLEALRLSAIKTGAVIILDWLDPSASWDSFWNPCAILEPIKSKLENRLIDFIDQIVQRTCASQTNAFMQQANCFFDNTYLPHRKHSNLPELNKIIFAPSKQINSLLDLFKAEKNLLGYTNKPLRKRPSTEDNEWLPAII